MATADLTVIPIGREGASTGDVIAEIQRRLEGQEKVRFRVRATSTELEGSIEDILAVVSELHAVPLESGIPRVYTLLKIDERRDREQTLADKEESVRRRLRAERGAGYPPGD